VGSPQAVDPRVSQAKFDREIAQYRALAQEHSRRGWWLIDAEFPKVFVVFATPKLKPPAVVFGAMLDFTDYDFQPPSVRLVDPFTREPYKARELPSVLRRIVPAVPQVGGFIMAADQQLMQAAQPDEIPFLCLPGVREYHDHPAHTGDSWLLHRGGTEGSLHFILDVLYRYGVQPISEYAVGQIVTGFRQGMPPQ
jgi:hypothetical protein